MANKRSSRTYLIEPSFQIRVVRYFAFLFLLLGVMNLAVVYTFFHTFRNHGLTVGLSEDHVFFQFIREQENSLYFLMGCGLLVSLAILVIGGFVLSHRVAGPLHRLKTHFRLVGEKRELSPVKFREKDFFHDLEEEYNSMVGKIRK